MFDARELGCESYPRRERTRSGLFLLCNDFSAGTNQRRSQHRGDDADRNGKPKRMHDLGRTDREQAEGQQGRQAGQGHRQGGAGASFAGQEKERRVVDADAQDQQQREQVEQAEQLIEPAGQRERGQRRDQRNGHHCDRAAPAEFEAQAGQHQREGRKQQHAGPDPERANNEDNSST